MGALTYYLALPFIYGISLLPYPLLFILSDVLNLIVFSFLGYRKEVILTNLRNSFPKKNEQEIHLIAKKFKSWFCDMVLESLTTLTASPEVIKRHVSVEGFELLRNYAAQRQSIIIVLGHYGNWELAGARYSQEKDIPPLYVIYHPLQNPYSDRLAYHMRTRHGTRLYSMKDTGKSMLRDRDLLTATAFIADQTPSPERAYWMEFLEQDTPIYLGTEALAKKLGYPVVYISISRPRRGYYHMRAETIVPDPAVTSPGEITEIHTRRLEKDIRNTPEIWLWTHRRWKHRRT